MSQIPLPNDYRSLSRLLKSLQDEVTRLKSRTLGTSSLTTGTLQVRGGGKINVCDGGTITVSNGGRLYTDSDATSTSPISVSTQVFDNSQTPIPRSQDWVSAASVNLVAPEWASKVIIQAFGEFNYAQWAGGEAPATQGRITVNKNPGFETLAWWEPSFLSCSWHGVHTLEVDVSGNPNLEIAVETRTNNPGAAAQTGSAAHIHGLVTWLRK